MNTRIYFDNLPETVTEKELMDLFCAYGNIVNVHITAARATHESRGSGFVTMITPEGARAAIQALNGKIFGSRTLTLSEAPPKEVMVNPAFSSSVPRRVPSYLF